MPDPQGEPTYIDNALVGYTTKDGFKPTYQRDHVQSKDKARVKALLDNPEELLKEVKKNARYQQGGYIPGVRPGKTTADFLYKIMNRITLTGSVFLGTIAVLPFIVQGITGNNSMQIGGTSILIVVSVVIETIKQIEGQLVMRDYEGF